MWEKFQTLSIECLPYLKVASFKLMTVYSSEWHSVGDKIVFVELNLLL